MFTLTEKKAQLLEAITAEKKRLDSQGRITLDHELTIQYLTKGTSPVAMSNVESWELLDAAMNDFETMYKDYCGNDMDTQEVFKNELSGLVVAIDRFSNAYDQMEDKIEIAYSDKQTLANVITKLRDLI